ncbi:diguanylate cyclase response regulator [Bdellovibrio sp. qaytius]|nr:diguanylate cyclase response regulator [Bdellovibrio sp. qaytius]
MKKDPKQRPILVLDEDPDTLELMAEPLRWEGYDVHGFTSEEKATEALNYLRPQLIILDPDFAEGNGFHFVNNLFSTLQKVPVLVVSTNPTTEKITQFLDLGASDFISSPFVPMEFLARVRTQLRMRDMQEELLASNHKLQEMIEIDDLTGLFNTRSLYSKLEFEIERAQRFERPVTVIMIDMDKFKSVNDGHDHLFGSFVISEVGKIIRQNTRTVDIPARYGGDEFLIVLSEIPLSGVEFFCEKLRNRVEQHTFSSGPDSIKLTLSIGFATYDGDPTQMITGKELVRRADSALYEAKHQGRNRVISYDPKYDRLHKFEKSSVSALFEKNKKTA